MYCIKEAYSYFFVHITSTSFVVNRAKRDHEHLDKSKEKWIHVLYVV